MHGISRAGRVGRGKFEMRRGPLLRSQHAPLTGRLHVESGLAKSHAAFSGMTTLLANLDRRHLIMPEGAEIVADHVPSRHAASVLLGAA